MEKDSATYRVMIVDDEAILRTGMLHLCNWSEYGIEIVAQAGNGQEALQLMDNYQPHVVITDIVMPVMDGVEFTKMMRLQHPEIKIVVLSSYSEFNYVREVFKYGVTDYLLKPKVSATELISLIQSLCSDIDLTSMNKLPAKKDPALLLNQWLDSDAALEDKEELRRDLNDHFRLRHYIMAKASTNLLLSRTKWTQSQIEQMIINLAAEHLAEIDYVCVFLKNEALLLLNYDAQQSVEVLSSLNRFGEHVKNSMNYISFVLSNTFDSFDLIKTEHERLTPFLGRLIYFTGKVIVPENEIIETNDHDSMHFDESHFTSALRMLAIDDVISQLKALFSEIQISRSYDEYSLKRFCQNLIYSTISTFEQLKQPVTELGSSKLKLFKTIDHAFDIQELESILIQFIEELKTIVKRSDHQQSLILHQIYEYVNENYANDISLSEMASSLHLNYTYLSSYFKQRTHENLTSYISRVRTDKAKELLSDQELSVSEISRLTGFSDHNYFSKVFKKMTGMTPVEYRNQITQ